MAQAVAVHRYQYQPEKISRCYVQPEVPPKWRVLARQCMPTHEQACDFNKIPIEEMYVPDYERDYDKPKAYAQKRGWKYLGCGLGRCAFEWKDGCVIKVARSSRKIVGGREVIYGSVPWQHKADQSGADQNAYEVANYYRCADNIKELLAPISAHAPPLEGFKANLYTWMVLPKAQTEHDEGARIWDAVDYLEREFDERGATVIDIHRGNVGRLNGSPVMIDYGFAFDCPPREEEKKPAPKAMSLQQFMGEPTKVTKIRLRGLSPKPKSSDVVNALLKAVKDFDLRKYPSQAGRNFDDLLSKAEKARIRGEYPQAMRYVELAREQMKSKPLEGLAALFPKKGQKVPCNFDWECVANQVCHKGFCTPKTKHRGRHGLKRTRAEKGGELTQKRRVLWARAGELRRHAKKLHLADSQQQQSVQKAMVDDARFLEQQAWHYQTKQMRSGRAPISDPQKMLGILHPDQRNLFEPEMKKVMSRSALREFGLGLSPTRTPTRGTFRHETPPEEA